MPSHEIRQEWGIRMNSRQSLYDVASFYDKRAKLKASFGGMRYQVEQAECGEEKKLRATVWPEPFCYERTAEEKREVKLFDYTEEGLDDVYRWLCDKYEEERPRWEHARDFPFEGLVSVETQ